MKHKFRHNFNHMFFIEKKNKKTKHKINHIQIIKQIINKTFFNIGHLATCKVSTLKICVVCFQASIAPPFPICPLKECNCSMDTLFCFEKGAM